MFHTVASPWAWGGFLALIGVILALDLGLFHKKAHTPTLREAFGFTGLWTTLALAFGGVVGWLGGGDAAIAYWTGWMVEWSLSIDNLFVFVLVFTTLGIPRASQHRVLFWGILTALALRAVMILVGAALLERFHFLIYVFGAFLLITGAKLLLARGESEGPPKWMTALTRLIPSTPHLHGEAFVVREGARWLATPLLVALVLVELTDVVFALDSIPAIFGITNDPFVVFTSNMFAILGLRSLFFVLADLVERFVYLKTGLALVLLFIGGKMVASGVVHLPAVASLAVVLSLLGGSIVASWWATRSDVEVPARAPVE